MRAVVKYADPNRPDDTFEIDGTATNEMGLIILHRNKEFIAQLMPHAIVGIFFPEASSDITLVKGAVLR